MHEFGLYLILLNFLGHCDPGHCVVRFLNPYFLYKNEEGGYIAVETEDCKAGAFTNVEVKLTEFCVTGVWLLSNAACSDAESDRFIVSGKDSCFKIAADVEIRVKRFLPLMHNMSDFEGYAYAFTNNFAYFVRLNSDNKTEMKPLAQSRGEWSVLTVNFGTYGRYLNEYTAAKGGKMGDRHCYKTQPVYVTQVYSLEGDGDTTFYPYRDTMECLTGFNKSKHNYSLPVGNIRFLKEPTVINSTHSYRSLDLREDEIQQPFNQTEVSGACSEEKPVVHPQLNLQVPEDKFPLYPHLQPPTFMDEIISDEIQSTAQTFMEFTLYNTPLPLVNRSEWKYIVASTIMLSRHCCNAKVKYAEILQLRRLFRLTYTYFAQYYPYEELPDPRQEERIVTALGTCMNVTLGEGAFPCVIVNMTESCPEQVNSTTFNKTIYNDTDINDDIVFEVGNLDYVTEMMWKAGLFVHYFCSPYFNYTTDHSAFYSKLESFFNPLVRKKWVQPRGVHRIYELLLSGIDFKGLATTVDSCVTTAKEASEYNRWLNRPGTFEFIDTPEGTTQKPAGRRKRAASKNKGGSTKSLGNDANCVPANKPKLLCLDKQFDLFDQNLIFPKQTSEIASCNAVVQKKQTYKYIHANDFGTSY